MYCIRMIYIHVGSVEVGRYVYTNAYMCLKSTHLLVAGVRSWQFCGPHILQETEISSIETQGVLWVVAAHHAGTYIFILLLSGVAAVLWGVWWACAPSFPIGILLPHLKGYSAGNGNTCIMNKLLRLNSWGCLWETHHSVPCTGRA